MLEGPHKPRLYVKEEETDAGGELYADYYKKTLTSEERTALKEQIKTALNTQDRYQKDDHTEIVKDTFQYNDILGLTDKRPGEAGIQDFIETIQDEHLSLEDLSGKLDEAISILAVKKENIEKRTVLENQYTRLKKIYEDGTPFPKQVADNQSWSEEEFKLRLSRYPELINFLSDKILELDLKFPSEQHTPEAITQEIESLKKQWLDAFQKSEVLYNRIDPSLQ